VSDPATQSSSAAATASPSSEATAVSFAERLYLPWRHWLLPLLAAGLLAAEADMGYPGLGAWLPYLITIPLAALLLWRASNAKIVVCAGELRAGQARLPLRLIREIQIVPPEAKRAALGPGFDPAAFALTRSWIPSMVWIKTDNPDNPDDSVPYWLVSTRSPARLVAALQAGR
jgi:hypothetical protein